MSRCRFAWAIRWFSSSDYCGKTTCRARECLTEKLLGLLVTRVVLPYILVSQSCKSPSSALPRWATMVLFHTVGMAHRAAGRRVTIDVWRPAKQTSRLRALRRRHVGFPGVPPFISSLSSLEQQNRVGGWHRFSRSSLVVGTEHSRKLYSAHAPKDAISAVYCIYSMYLYI